MAGANAIAHEVGANLHKKIKLEQIKKECPPCYELIKKYMSGVFNTAGLNETESSESNLKSLLQKYADNGVLIIGPGGQLYEVDYGEGTAGRISTLDLSDPDNIFNTLNLVQVQGKSAVEAALIIGFYEDNPVLYRNKDGYRIFEEVKGRPGIYYSPFKKFRGPNWEVVYFKYHYEILPNGRKKHYISRIE